MTGIYYIPKPQRLDVFLQKFGWTGLVENEYLLPKLARFEDEMAMIAMEIAKR